MTNAATETKIETETQAPKIRGYHEDRELPYREGEVVVIPAGTVIRGMGKVKVRTAPRSFKIKINHFLPGQSLNIGYITDSGERRACGVYRKDEDAIVQKYGKGSADLINHPDVQVRTIYGGRPYLYLPMSNPTVRWPGTGGYWQEVDINDVRPVQVAAAKPNK